MTDAQERGFEGTEKGDVAMRALRILVLEDAPGDAELIIRLLTKKLVPFEYCVVDDKPGFEDAVASFVPDVILSDYSLPAYSGMEALAFCRTNHPSVPFIFVTGAIGEELVIETLKSGAADYVLKDRIARLPEAVLRALHEAEERVRRMEAEREVRASLSFLQLILDTIPEPVYYKDANLAYQLCNDAFASRILGLPKEKIVGRSMIDLAGPIPADLAEKYVARDRSLLAGQGRQSYEGEALCADGKRRHFVFSKAAHVTADGQTSGIVGVMIDITKLKEAEEELVRANKTLLDSNRDLEQFAYCASHDLKEPLRMITEFMERLKKKYFNLFDETALDYIRFATDGAAHMKSLINGLLDFARIGKNEMTAVPVDAQAVLGNVLSMLSPLLEESRAVVTFDRLPVILADKMLLTQLFQNLVENAVKFRGEAPPVVHVRAEDDGEWCRLSIADNGIGIETQYHEKVFEIFQQIHGRHEYPGSGIGLAVCKKIVERFGGRIWIESRPGNGTVFFCTFRRAENGNVKETSR